MNFSRCTEVCPTRASGFSEIVFTRCYKKNERRLTSDKPKWKRWKMNIKDVHKNSRSALTLLYFCIVAYWHCINVNDSFWMETCFARPNTIIANKETGWKQFLQSQIKTSAKVLVKSTSCFRIIFSPCRSEFAYVCRQVQNAGHRSQVTNR